MLNNLQVLTDNARLFNQTSGRLYRHSDGRTLCYRGKTSGQSIDCGTADFRCVI